MSRRHRSHAKRRRRPIAAPTPQPGPGLASPDDIALSHPGEGSSPIDLDRLVEQLVPAGPNQPGLREPPALIVEGPDGAARRRARDARDGVETADPRRGPLYVGIALFVAMLLFAILSLIEMREVPRSLAP